MKEDQEEPPHPCGRREKDDGDNNTVGLSEKDIMDLTGASDHGPGKLSNGEKVTSTTAASESDESKAVTTSPSSNDNGTNQVASGEISKIAKIRPKIRSTIPKGKVNQARGSTDDETNVPQPGAVAVTAFRPETEVPLPGVLAVNHDNNNRRDEEAGHGYVNPNSSAVAQDSQQQQQPEQPEPLPPPEMLVNAHLVGDNSGRGVNDDDNDQDLVHAEPAKEGIAAILENKYFKGLACLVLVVVMLAIAIPLAILLPSSESSEVTKEAEPAVTNVAIREGDTCGSRDIYQGDYRGPVSVTELGIECQAWTSQHPHPHEYSNPGKAKQLGLEGNQCRNPCGGCEPRTWCYTVDPNVRWAFCDVPFCNETELVLREDCQSDGKRGTDYRGTVAVSATGKTCQRWDSQSPHSHGNRPERRPSAGLIENYCRNPDSNGPPYCYTMDESSRWEYCDLPPCEVLDSPQSQEQANASFVPRYQCGSPESFQGDYRGDIKVSSSGKECLKWDGDEAKTEKTTPLDYPWDGLVGNYCRLPNGGRIPGVNSSRGVSRSRPWCYVRAAEGEPNWEYCDVETCSLCGTSGKNKTDYTGTQSLSRTGKSCLPWEGMEEFLVQANSAIRQNFTLKDVTVLHRFGIRRDLKLEANYCRNPLNRETVWCYVDNDGSWEFCDVHECQENEDANATNKTCGSQSVRQADYRGRTNTSVSGQACEPWVLQDEYSPSKYPDAGLDGSFCRQPAASGRLAAWCFVNVSEMKWEYCDVPVCDEI